MNKNDLNCTEQFLSISLERAIRRAVTEVAIYKGYKLGEPDYIAALASHFPERMCKILRESCPQYNFTVSSVFCHQSPIVHFDDAQENPELGDILFVYIETKDNKTMYNSLLLQAKMSEQETHIIGSDELHQLKLYQEWPYFSYVRPPHLKGKKRNIQPKTINGGAKYLMVHPRNPGDRYFREPMCFKQPRMFSMGCATPDYNLILEQSLSWELIDFFKFKTGRTFEKDWIETDDDWTRMIWDLLSVAFRPFNLRAAGFQNTPRGVFYSSGNLTETHIFQNIQRYSDMQIKVDDYSNGLSIVIIEGAERTIR